MQPSNQKGTNSSFSLMYDDFVGFKILETCDLGSSCRVFASLRVGNAEDATLGVCVGRAAPASSSSLCSLKVAFLIVVSVLQVSPVQSVASPPRAQESVNIMTFPSSYV